MKLGTENKKKTYIAIGLMVLGILLAIYTVRPFFTAAPAAESAGAATPPAAATQARRTGRRTGRGRTTVAVLSPTLDPRLRTDLLKESEQLAYVGGGRNIFRAEAEPAPIPKPITPPIPNPQPVVNTPPPPPPIPLRFFGFANKPGEPKRVFLAEGEDVFVAGIGDVVDRRYKVTKIGVNTVEIQDVLNNNTQTIQLSQG